MKADIYNQYLKLQPPPSSEEKEKLSVKEIYADKILIAKSSENKPALILSVADKDEFATTMELFNLRARHNCKVTLMDDSGHSYTGPFTLIECLSSKPELQSLFLRSIGHALPDVIENISTSEVIDLVDHLAELFKSASKQSSGEALGLWSELFIIHKSTNQSKLINAWHNDVNSHYDFSLTNERVEVKASTGAYRKHSLSFEQANPPNGTIGIIISILTEETSGGLSIMELWQSCQDSTTNPKAQAKIDRLCLATLGTDWHLANEWRFDDVKAEQSLRVYKPDQIPRIESKPPGVGNVRFESDMTRSSHLKGSPKGSPQDGIIQSLFDGFCE